jgi:L-alanine-DL-glutamate epimerase-like enolase superfamily enzyme
MKITKVEVWDVKMALTVPYTISYETVYDVTNVFLRLDTDKGITGYGCAAPDINITNETSDQVLKVINEKAKDIIIGADPLRPVLILENLKNVLNIYPSAKAAIDIALYDIIGKYTNLPLWKLLGGYKDKISTSITIGILPVSDTIKQAKEYIARGYNSLKIKGGKNVDDDVERVIKLRKAVGSNIEFRFDANQGYSVEETLKFIDATKKANIELIEQPTTKGEPDLLGRVTNATSILIMADESLMNLVDAFRLAKNELVDMVNVKLMKVGGITEAMHINSVARAAGLEVMVGCMDEAALSIAAGMHFALARPNVTYADLDGHLDLENDPTNGAVNIKDGVLFPNDLPGLGFAKYM